MTWTCEQTEARLSDYLDGSLNAAETAAFDAHVPSCARCAPLLGSVSALVTDLHAMEPLPAPPRLVYAILDKTLGPRDTQAGFFGWIRGIASLRFAYGAVSVAATLLILASIAGVNWKHPKVSDLQPANIYRSADRQAHIFKAKGIKFVNDLRVVNEIQSRLRQDTELPALEQNTAPEPHPQKAPGQSDGTKPATPRQQNRANDLGRHLEVLAMQLPLGRIHVSGL
jgi:anti-sigma factor RsiW